MGTAVGSCVFLEYGWRPAAALSVAWSGFTLAVLFARGPHCGRYTWVGYEGGCALRRRADADEEQKHHQAGGDEEHKTAPVSTSSLELPAPSSLDVSAACCIDDPSER